MTHDVPESRTTVPRLIEQFEHGLDAPICLTWELTYACNLACVHCLSSSGKRDPRELSTRQCMDIIDELERMQVFYVNIGGGEPTVRSDFWELVDYATAHHVGVKFSTNGVQIDEKVAAKLAASDYVDVQISLDGATADVNDAVRGQGSFAMAVQASGEPRRAGFKDAKISVVVTRHNVGQLDEFKALADQYGATLRITRLRPSGRGADVWDELHPTAAQQVAALRLAGRPRRGRADRRLVLPPVRTRGARRTGRPEPLRRGPRGLPHRSGRRRLRVPVRDPRPFPGRKHRCATRDSAIPERLASTHRCFGNCASRSRAGACASCDHYDGCRGGCMAAKFFTGLPMDGPDPECVVGHGESALARERDKPKPSGDHSRTSAPPSPASLLTRPRPPEEVLQRKSRLDHGPPTWFETVAIAQERAKKRLPKSVVQLADLGAVRRASPSPTTSTRSANSGSHRT